MLTGIRNQLIIPAGVDKDDNAYTTLQWSDADKMRFYRGYPQTIGGWSEIGYNNGQTITGVPRSIWAYVDALGVENILIGTHTRLYAVQKGKLYNITPLVASTTAIMNSLANNWKVLSNNPIATEAGSTAVTLTVAPFAIGLFQKGDNISINAAAVVGGLNVNGTRKISSVNALTGKITFMAGSAAASTVSAGGGAAVELATKVITVAHVAHGFLDGDRIGILGATAFGGFAVGDINIEAVIRNISVNEYSYYSTAADISLAFSTSPEVTGQGGAATTVQGQIGSGACQYRQAVGYGMGPYGRLAYSTPRPSTGNLFQYPRVWSFARFGSNIVLTPGNQTGLYLWAGDIATAPALQTAGSCPTAINYVSVMNNQVVVFGAAGVVNNIRSTNDITNWTASPARLFFNGTVTNAARLIASEYCKGQYVIFTTDSVHKMTFVGAPAIWLIEDIMTSDGLIGPQAADSIQDNVVWAGQNNLYIYNGSIVSVIPNNTLNEWFFTNLSDDTYYHSFTHKSLEFNEIWWFAPFGGSEEPDNYIIWNWQEGHFTNGTLSRTASEEPTNISRNQYMAFGQCSPAINGVLYQHEAEGEYSDNGANMVGSLTSNYALIGDGQYMQAINRIIPSTTLLPLDTEKSKLNTMFLCNLSVYTKEYDSALDFRTFGPYPIYDNTQKIEARINGRQRQYKFEFDGKTGFRLEKFYEEVKVVTPR